MSLFAFQDIVTSVTGIVLLIAMSMAMRVATAPAYETKASVLDAATLASTIEATTAEADRLEASFEGIQELITESSSGSSILEQGAIPTLQAEVERESKAVLSLRAKLESLRNAQDILAEELKESPGQRRVKELKEETAELESDLEQLVTSNRILFNKPPEEKSAVYLLELFPEEIRIAELGIDGSPQVFQGQSVLGDATAVIRRLPRRSRWVVFAHPGATTELGELRQLFRSRGTPIGFDLLPTSVSVIDPVKGAH